MREPSRVFWLACRRNPCAFRSFPSVRSEISCPIPTSATRNFPRLLDVHRSGDSGSPRVAGSISRSRSSTTNGSVSTTGRRPPPDRRTCPRSTRSPDSTSASPRRTVSSESPSHTRKQRHTTRPMRLGLARRPQPPAALVTLRAEQTPALRDLRLRHTIKRGRQSVGFWHATSFSTRAKAPFHNATNPPHLLISERVAPELLKGDSVFETACPRSLRQFPSGRSRAPIAVERAVVRCSSECARRLRHERVDCRRRSHWHGLRCSAW